jgi:hypothetical protein
MLRVFEYLQKHNLWTKKNARGAYIYLSFDMIVHTCKIHQLPYLNPSTIVHALGYGVIFLLNFLIQKVYTCILSMGKLSVKILNNLCQTRIFCRGIR